MPRDIRDLLEAQKESIEEAGRGLLAGDNETVTKSLVGLAIGVATSSPTLGALSSEVVAKLFASTATKRLRQAIAEADAEEQRQVFVRDIAAAIESLLGEFVVQVARVHHDVSATIVAQLGGKAELADFGAEVATELADYAVHVERIDVSEGGLGLRVSTSGRSAFVREMSVRGAGSVGLEV
jgi:hypothetical protein